jgi:hypothetical protein
MVRVRSHGWDVEVLQRTRRLVLFYGLADSRLTGSDLGEVVELYVEREQAENDLGEVLADEPGWRDSLRVVTIDLGQATEEDRNVRTNTR